MSKKQAPSVRLLNELMRTRDFQALLDLARPTFGNPMILSNGSYSVIAITDEPDIHDPRWLEIVQTRGIPLGVITFGGINEAYRSQMRFVSDASHELRTPIAVIQGYANLLNRWGKDDPATRQEAIDAIRQEADSMKELVEQLLFLARGDNDSMHIEMETFDLTEVAAEVLKETGMIDQTHTFSARWEGAVPVCADVGLTKQALRILVDNSIKYTPAGGHITLSAALRDGMSRLSVQDEGQGIDAGSLPHVFDRFYRCDEARKSQTSGHGLGLSIARIIVSAHGGHLRVRSKVGVGTTFTACLPLEKS